jgi:uncharacterized phiE125 gp8 family phage protein
MPKKEIAGHVLICARKLFEEEEPLSLADAKLFLHIDHTVDDTLISDLIRAARKHVETVTGKRLVTQIWRLVLDQWPEDGVMKLRAGERSARPPGSGTVETRG